MRLEPIDEEFVAFMAHKRQRPLAEIRRIFSDTKRQFRFEGLMYRAFCVDVHNAFQVLYDDTDERTLVTAYQFHELLHLFRFLSYVYPRPSFAQRIGDMGAFALQTLLQGKLGSYRAMLRDKLRPSTEKDQRSSLYYKQTAAHIRTFIPEDLIIVDYGCGLGHLSFELAQKNPRTKVYLVDIDCLTLEFAAYRFRQAQIDVEVIPISHTTLYPMLPKHNLCIATEVMEHLKEPLTAFRNISTNLAPNGILYGTFSDHHAELFHVSTDLQTLRAAIAEQYTQLRPLMYRKRP
jgi:SAM-dependent methyltransferase